LPPFRGQRRSSRKPPEPTKDEDKPDCARKTRWRRPPSQFDTILYATDFTSLYRPKTSDESHSRGDAHERICYLLSAICHFIRASGENEPRLVAVSNGRVERERHFLLPASKKQSEWRQRHQLHRRESNCQAARPGGSQIARNSTN
jgi:hypothetical protein